MLNFYHKKDSQTGETWLETDLKGKSLLTTPQLNKGTAFTEAERDAFHLRGKLPHKVETLEQQVDRAYKQFSTFTNKLKCHIFLNNLHDENQVLFYELTKTHLEEMLPTLYTPIVGSAVKVFSHEFRTPRGLFLSYPDKDRLAELLDHRSNPDIDLIVVSDGEGVLGIGDQGIGGMDIPIAKLMVYTLCGGIDPCRTLPIFIDVGTNNKDLLNDPLYLGWRQPRINKDAYDAFIGEFVESVQEKFPQAFLHWEDLGRDNANRVLERYQDDICTFNDDIQGTGAVTLAALLAALKVQGQDLQDQRIVVFGAGTAGTGISNQLCRAVEDAGLSPEEARKVFWLVDHQGLLHQDLANLTDPQVPYARALSDLSDWDVNIDQGISLLETIEHVKPTVLIGTSAVAGAFSEKIVRTLAEHNRHPIIFPLSNPTERVEATPQDLLDWTDGRALIATGSPFPPSTFHDHVIDIAQCNNALIFPGVGLGIIVVKARRLSNAMLWQACHALSEAAPALKDPEAPLLPPLSEAPQHSKAIAFQVAKQAVKDNLTDKAYSDDEIKQAIEDYYWDPHYSPYRCIPQ